MTDMLTWALIRKNSSKRVARQGKILSRESNNLRNLHTPRFSGLTNAKTVGVNPSGKGIAFTMTSAKNQTKPKKATTTQVLNKGIRRTNKTIKKSLAARNYRHDLVRAALERATKINKSSVAN
eukprot:TRINITY_DN709_c0_g2_i2.p1 TRINITY_DN709_c0_g2~~TRINITY_DN709_c0_g2_i2.p1  ORF type:complete len:123 (-),score=46.35 TRINITY_DN709_c0_g2_i2:47-415(-)